MFKRLALTVRHVTEGKRGSDRPRNVEQGGSQTYFLSDIVQGHQGVSHCYLSDTHVGPTRHSKTEFLKTKEKLSPSILFTTIGYSKYFPSSTEST